MDGKRDELGLTSRLIVGGIAGFVATLAMTAAMRRMHRRLPRAAAADSFPRAAAYMGWIPAFGLLRPATDHPNRRNLLMLGAHFAWGWSTAAGMRELGRARTTVFAAGPAADAPAANRS